MSSSYSSTSYTSSSADGTNTSHRHATSTHDPTGETSTYTTFEDPGKIVDGPAVDETRTTSTASTDSTDSIGFGRGPGSGLGLPYDESIDQVAYDPPTTTTTTTTIVPSGMRTNSFNRDRSV